MMICRPMARGVWMGFSIEDSFEDEICPGR